MGNGQQLTREPHWTKAGLIVSSMDVSEVRSIEERSKSHAGEPGGFSLFGFAVGTVLIAIPLSGFVPTDTGVLAVTAPVLVFAGLAQFIGGLVALGKADTFAGTAFCVYGANNTLIATYYLFQVAGVFPRNPSTTLLIGAELLCFAFISLVLGFAALTENWTFVAILWALVPGFGLVGVHNVGFAGAFGHIGGYFLILSAVLAFYGASALVLNSSFERTVLPLLPRN